MERVNYICKGMESKLAEMLLDSTSAPAEVHTHFAECGSCRKELEALRSMMDAMDAWQAPEPNPYFLTRLEARMREERHAEPEGWFAKLRDRFAYGPSMHVRPIAAMAMTVVLLIGGGAYLNFSNVWNSAATTTAAPSQTAVVHDLQTLDNNAQLLDSLEAISGAANPGSDSNANNN